MSERVRSSGLEQTAADSHHRQNPLGLEKCVVLPLRLIVQFRECGKQNARHVDHQKPHRLNRKLEAIRIDTDKSRADVEYSERNVIRLVECHSPELRHEESA